MEEEEEMREEEEEMREEVEVYDGGWKRRMEEEKVRKKGVRSRFR